MGTRLFWLAALLGVFSSPLTIAASSCGLAADRWLRRWESNLELPADGLNVRFPTREPGVWLEREEKSDGTVIVRRVSPRLTEWVTLLPGRCRVLHQNLRRRFSEMPAEAWRDEDWKALVQSGGTGVLYAWSPRMPLSVLGIAEIRAFAAREGLQLTVVTDPHASREEVEVALRQHGLPLSLGRPLEALDLFYRGLPLHYPSIQFYADRQIVGPAIPGYKAAPIYASLFHRFGFPAPGAAYAGMASASPSLADTVTEIKKIDTTLAPSYFFKPTNDGEWVGISAVGKNYLFNLDSGKAIEVPGLADPVPTPDGKYLTVPMPLRFFLLSQLLQSPNPAQEAPLVTDMDVSDQYQSVGTLAGDKLRVITGYLGAVGTKDYQIVDGKPNPIGKWKGLCPDIPMSLPIISKNGLELAARDNASAHNKIFHWDAAGKCHPVLDTKLDVGKMAFSYDGESIAFSAMKIASLSAGEWRRPSDLQFLDAYVCRRQGWQCTRLTDNSATGDASYPEFLPNGQVVYLQTPHSATVKASFHVVELR